MRLSRWEVRNGGVTFREEPRGLTHLKGLSSPSTVSSTFCLFSAASALLRSISSFIFLFSSWERQTRLALRRFRHDMREKSSPDPRHLCYSLSCSISGVSREHSVNSIGAYVGGALFSASSATPDIAAHAGGPVSLVFTLNKPLLLLET